MSESYESVRAEAQRAADADGFDRGVEKLGDRWRFFMLPQRRNRYGFELRCEVVSCSDLKRCAYGHGPRRRQPRSMPR